LIGDLAEAGIRGGAVYDAVAETMFEHIFTLLETFRQVARIGGLIGAEYIGTFPGRNELMSYVNKCDPRPKKIIINHGENSRCLDLASSLHKTYRLETVAPRNLETVRLK